MNKPKSPAPQRNNGPRSDGKPSKGSSADRFRRHGAASVKMIPEIYPEDVRLAFETGHPGQAAHVPFRYNMTDNPDNVRDLAAIRANNYKLQQIPKVSVIEIDGREVVVCDDGSRGMAMLRTLNKELVAAGKPRVTTPVDFQLRGATASSSFLRHLYGNFHSADGMMTRARKMAMLYHGDESIGIKPHTAQQIGEIWGVSPEVVDLSVDSERGIIAISDRFGDALESGKVSLMNARHAARILVGASMIKRHAAMDRFLDALLALKSPPSRARSSQMAKLAEQGEDPSKPPVESQPRERQTFGKKALQDVAGHFRALGEENGPNASKYRFAESVLQYMENGHIGRRYGLEPEICAAIDKQLGRNRRGEAASR